jgi:hypothetical protein
MGNDRAESEQSVLTATVLAQSRHKCIHSISLPSGPSPMIVSRALGAGIVSTLFNEVLKFGRTLQQVGTGHAGVILQLGGEVDKLRTCQTKSRNRATLLTCPNEMSFTTKTGSGGKAARDASKWLVSRLGSALSEPRGQQVACLSAELAGHLGSDQPVYTRSVYTRSSYRSAGAYRTIAKDRQAVAPQPSWRERGCTECSSRFRIDLEFHIAFLQP